MKKKKHGSALGDLTINDSANALKAFKRASKKVSGPAAVDDNPEEVDSMEPQDTGMPVGLMEVRSPPAINPPSESYRFILPEIWIIIAQHIRPEDVANFAAICRTTYSITQSAQFWFRIYGKFGPVTRRFGGTEIDLPMRLRPESMVRLGGLRACVIRTLFYTYGPFAARLESLNRNLDLTSFSFSRRLKIRHMWCVKLKHWCYYFHLQGPVPSDNNSCNSRKRSRDHFLNVLENPDDGCRIFALESPKYVPLPHMFDQAQQIYLKAVTYTMSFGLRNYKVNMELVYYNSSPFTKLVFDPAHNIKVWDWWHPNYHQVKDNEQTPLPIGEDLYFDHF